MKGNTLSSSFASGCLILKSLVEVGFKDFLWVMNLGDVEPDFLVTGDSLGAVCGMFHSRGCS